MPHALIRPPFALQSDLRWTALAHEPFRLLVPRATRGDNWAELLASQPFIRYDRASFGGRQVDRFLRSMHFTLKEVCEADELEAIVKLVSNGVGVARGRARHRPGGAHLPPRRGPGASRRAAPERAGAGAHRPAHRACQAQPAAGALMRLN